jgi:tetratricopeptide (TPR) repeat protein
MRLFSEGLGQFNLPELEILDCPADQVLLGYCHGMLYIAIGSLQLSKEEGRPIKSGDIVDLRSTEDDKPIRIRIVSSGLDMLRLEDLEPASDLFPSSATASYILTAAEKLRRPAAVLEAAGLAAEIHAKDFAYEALHPTEAEFMDAVERSNARSYYMIGDALDAMNRREEEIEAVEKAVARAPYMAEWIKTDIQSDHTVGLVGEYLASIDPWEVQARFRDKVPGRNLKKRFFNDR